MKLKEDVDYKQILISVSEELQDSEEYIFENTVVTGTEQNNDLTLITTVFLDEYLFTLTAKYDIDEFRKQVKRDLSIEYTEGTDYNLSEEQIKTLQDIVVYVKKLMEV